MKILAVSAFEPRADSGAAGSIAAVNAALARAGHPAEALWRAGPPGFRPWDELVGVPAALERQAAGYLAAHPDTDVVVASQPYAHRLFRSLKRRFPRTLFVNRTHGWEAREEEVQARFGWDPPAGVAGQVLRPTARRLRRRMCRLAATAADGVLAACRADADWIRAAYRLPDWRVASIPYGVDPADLPPDRRPAAGPGVRFVYAGQYLPRKGVRVLERCLPAVAREFPDARLTVVVPAAAAAEVERAHRAAWGDRLAVHPWVPRRRLYELYAASDVFLFPSYFEGYGKTAAEALAMGCTVVGFAEGVLADLDSPACRTCPVGDEAGFARLVRAAAAREVDPAGLAADAVRAGRGRTWDHTAADTVAFFRQLRDRAG